MPENSEHTTKYEPKDIRLLDSIISLKNQKMDKDCEVRFTKDGGYKLVVLDKKVITIE